MASNDLEAADDLSEEAMRIVEPVRYPVPSHLIAGLVRYKEQQIKPGGFLLAVLQNDLREAVGRADIHSQLALCAITSWCYNNLPSSSWGSPEKVQEWLTQ